jgi:hypothetical protein
VGRHVTAGAGTPAAPTAANATRRRLRSKPSAPAWSSLWSAPPLCQPRAQHRPPRGWRRSGRRIPLRTLAAAERLFSPSATIINRPSGGGLTTSAGPCRAGRVCGYTRGRARGERVHCRSLRQAEGRAHLPQSRYRPSVPAAVVYDWVLTRDDGGLRANMMTYRHEAQPEQPVGAARIRAHAGGANRRSGAPQTTFRPTDGICFRPASDQVQGGHRFLAVLRGPSGWTVRSPVLFGLGPIDAPGPREPLWICATLPGAPTEAGLPPSRPRAWSVAGQSSW